MFILKSARSDGHLSKIEIEIPLPGGDMGGLTDLGRPGIDFRREWEKNVGRLMAGCWLAQMLLHVIDF